MSKTTNTTEDAKGVGHQPLVLLFDGDKQVGAMDAHDGNHGIAIWNDADAIIGKRGDDRFTGEVDLDNPELAALIQFTSAKSIDAVIEWLWKAKKFFKENSEDNRQ